MSAGRWPPSSGTPNETSLSSIARFLDSIGYPPHPFHGVEARDMERREDRALLIRIAVAGAIAGNVMLLAFALYGGYFHGISPTFRRCSAGSASVSPCPRCGREQVFYRGAWGALNPHPAHGRPDHDRHRRRLRLGNGPPYATAARSTSTR